MLLDDFPHTIGVDSPTYGTDTVTGGNVITWAEVAADVPCQVTAKGGVTSDTFGGQKLIESATVSLTSDVLQHGRRVRWTPPGTTDVFYFLTDGGTGRVAGIGNIPTFFTWSLKGVIAAGV